MSHKFKRISDTEPNQMPDGLPRTINRVLGKFGIFLVDDEKPQILNIMAASEIGWAVVSFGNPRTGEITHQIEVPHGSRMSRDIEGSHDE